MISPLFFLWPALMVALAILADGKRSKGRVNWFHVPVVVYAVVFFGLLAVARPVALEYDVLTGQTKVVRLDDLVVPPTCNACNEPDLPWYIQAWCWLNC